MTTLKQELDTYYEDLEGYRKGGVEDITWVYEDLVNHLCNLYGVHTKDIYMLNHSPTGEICIYINGAWSGYVSDYDYLWKIVDTHEK